MRKERQRRSGIVGWARAIAALLLITVPPVASATVVVPNAQATTEGNTNNSFPFDCASDGLTSQRYQQVYLGPEVGSGTITQIAFRQDDGFGGHSDPLPLTVSRLRCPQHRPHLMASAQHVPTTSVPT